MNETETPSPDGPRSHDRGAGKTLASAWLRLIRIYTFNTPLAKGKYRLYQTALGFLSRPPRELPTQVKDGRRFVVDLTTGMQDTVFFLGEYERFITDISRLLIGEGEICIDAGANFGWYTTLMSIRVGQTGIVHAFEPVPDSFTALSRNRDLLPHPRNVILNHLALGDGEGVIQINLFDDQPTGHASLARKAQGQSSFDCRMTTLDRYLTEQQVGNVDFVKVDIEGAEMMMLKGARRLFEQTVPPIILMEMALEQSRHFGYTPDDLIKHIDGSAAYSFYRVDEPRQQLVRIDGFAADDIGANVFCIPDKTSDEKKAVMAKFVK